MPHTSRGTLWPSLSIGNWCWLLLGACCIAALSLGVHDLMLTKLRIPYPDAAAVPTWAKYLDISIRVAVLAWFCRLARPQLGRLTKLQAPILIGLCLVLLVETVRVFLIELCLTAEWPHNWAFTLLARLATALVWFYYGAAAALIARWNKRGSLGFTLGASLLVAAAGLFAWQPLLQQAATHLTQLLQLPEPVQQYTLPYPLYVQAVIYATFLEPTLASFGLAALIWPSLTGTSWQRTVQFAGLMLLLRGRVVALLLFSCWLPFPLATAFLSESQFFLETLLLGSLAGVTWAWVVRHQR